MSHGKGHFSHTSRTVQSVPPSKVLSNILAKPNQDGLFHLLSNQNFQNLGLNKRAPLDSHFANVFCINTIYHEYSFSLSSTVWMILRCTSTGIPPRGWADGNELFLY